MINEILQWLAIAMLATPKVIQVVQDFRNEEDE
jgi:hypothetical protein